MQQHTDSHTHRHTDAQTHACVAHRHTGTKTHRHTGTQAHRDATFLRMCVLVCELLYVRAYTHVLLPVRLFACEQICRRLYECVFSRSRSLNSSLACSHSLRLSPSSPPSLSLSDSPTLPFTFNMRACVVQAVISAWQTQTHNADTD